MDVKVDSEVRDFDVYETPKFKFKISKDRIDKMKEKKDFEGKIRKRVMKDIRLNADTATGAEWEESINAIVDEII